MTYCDFQVGDQVVCVEGAAPRELDGRTFELIEGQVYTIAAIAAAGQKTAMGRIASGEAHVQLVEFGHVETPTVWGTAARRFRKVQRRKTDLSIEAFSVIKPGFEEPKRAPAPKKERVS